MSDAPEYTPPAVWTWNKGSGGRFANINRPIAGPTHDKELPVGRHPMQLYSLGTPNGQKVTILLEELLAAGHSGAEYDAWIVNIREGDQFGGDAGGADGDDDVLAASDHVAHGVAGGLTGEFHFVYDLAGSFVDGAEGVASAAGEGVEEIGAVGSE